MPSNANETLAEKGIRTYTGEVFPYETLSDFLNSKDFLNIIIQVGQREGQMEDAVRHYPEDAYWQENLANARKAKTLCMQARGLCKAGRLR